MAVVPTGSWIPQALLCALSYALYNLFIKKASSSIDPILGGVILQFVAATLGSCLLLVTKKSTTLTQAAGIKWAVAAGVAVGAAEILSFLISSMGVPAMQSLPIVVGGSVLLGTLLGTFWLKEALSLRGWLGVLFIAGGIALVGMDSTSLH
jgi:transporter family protein